MAQKTIELGTAPDGMDGDDARTAFQKTNDNFTELYQGVGGAQPESPKLSAIAASVWAANTVMVATGAETLSVLTYAQFKTALALNNVDNTSDANKPISSATQTALSDKQNAHANLTGLASVAAGASQMPIFASVSGAMSTTFAGAAGRQGLASATWDDFRTLLEVTRPLSLTTKESGSFDDFVSMGWAPQIYRDSALTNSPGNLLAAAQRPSYWYLHNTMYATSSGSIVQVAYPYSISAADKGSICWRHRYSGIWGVWQRALTQQDQVSGTYDGTSGRIVTTGTASGDGWMGLGATSTPAVANLNTIVNTSFYTFNETAVGRPDLFGYGNVLTIIRASGEATQIAYSVVSPNSMFRRKLNNIWSAWTDATPIGIGQSWQDMTPQRAAGVNYVNSTGRPIQVSVVAQAGQVGNYFVLYVNGVPAAYSGSGFSTGAIIACQPVIVPPDATYSLATSSGVAMVGPSWKELR